MILAGVFNQVDENTFKELDSITSEKICKDKIYFKNNFVNIIVGKTSHTVDQGSILSLKEALLIGKVFNKNSYETITKEDLKNDIYENKNDFAFMHWNHSSNFCS